VLLAGAPLVTLEDGRDKHAPDNSDATIRHLASLAVVADAQNQFPKSRFGDGAVCWSGPFLTLRAL